MPFIKPCTLFLSRPRFSSYGVPRSPRRAPLGLLFKNLLTALESSLRVSSIVPRRFLLPTESLDHSRGFAMSGFSLPIRRWGTEIILLIEESHQCKHRS